MKDPLTGMLETLREVTVSLAASQGVTRPTRPRFFLPLLLASIAVASQPGFPAPAAVAAASGTAALLYALHSGAPRAAAKALLLVTLFSAVVSAPLLLSHRSEALGFLLRVYGASALGISATAMVGWDAFIDAAEALGLPCELATAARLLLWNVKIMSEEALRLIAARRARTLGKNGIMEEWRLLASAVAGLLEKSMHRAEQVSRAIAARSLGTSTARGRVSSGVSLIPYLAPAATIAAWVAYLAPH